MRLGLTFALLGASLAVAVMASAQQAPVQTRDLTKAPRRIPANSTSEIAPGSAEIAPGSASSIINGQAMASNNRPLPNVPVHLRNLETRQVEQRSVTNHLGQFVFVVKPNVPYVVEIASQDGEILAASDVITTQLGDVAGAMVTLPAPYPTMAGIFRDSVSAVLSAVSGAGMTAVDATVAPAVSPER